MKISKEMYLHSPRELFVSELLTRYYYAHNEPEWRKREEHDGEGEHFLNLIRNKYQRNVQIKQDEREGGRL